MFFLYLQIKQPILQIHVILQPYGIAHAYLSYTYFFPIFTFVKSCESNKPEVSSIVAKGFSMTCDLMFLPIGFTLQDSYRIYSYRICSYESNKMCRKFSYRIQILHNSYEIPMNQRSLDQTGGTVRPALI